MVDSSEKTSGSEEVSHSAAATISGDSQANDSAERRSAPQQTRERAGAGEMTYEDALEVATGFHKKRALALIGDGVAAFFPALTIGILGWALGNLLAGVDFLGYLTAGFVFYLMKTVPETVWQQSPGKSFANLKVATKENEKVETWKVFARNVPFLIFGYLWLAPFVLFVQAVCIRWTRFNQRPLDKLLDVYVMDVPPQEEMRRTTWFDKVVSAVRD